MGEKDFTRRQCLSALRALGFWHDASRRGRHDKYVPPKSILDTLAPHQAHFIMIPRHNEIHCQSEILKELKAMGGENLAVAFKEMI